MTTAPQQPSEPDQPLTDTEKLRAMGIALKPSLLRQIQKKLDWLYTVGHGELTLTVVKGRVRFVQAKESEDAAC